MTESMLNHYTHWNDNETSRLDALLTKHHGYDEIARALGRTEDSVEARARRLQMPAPIRTGYTLPKIAALMGWRWEVAREFVARGWLRVYRPGRLQIESIVDLDDLTVFIEDQSHWHEWDPSAITDLDLRAWASEIRGDVVFLTVAAVAERLCLTPDAIYWRIRRGDLRAVRCWTDEWRIRLDWLEAARPLLLAKRTGWRKVLYSDSENDFLRAWRPYQTVPCLAAALERAAASVRKQCLELGVTGPTIPQKERSCGRRRVEKVAA